MRWLRSLARIAASGIASMTLAPKSAVVLRWPISISGTAAVWIVWTSAAGLAGLAKTASRSASVGRLFFGNCAEMFCSVS